MDIDLKKFSKTYIFKKITDEDHYKVYKLYSQNTLYFEKSFEIPTLETVKQDSIELPLGKGLKDKFYLGIYKEAELVGVLDFCLDYPEENIYL